jgi:hypothetical protein
LEPRSLAGLKLGFYRMYFENHGVLVRDLDGQGADVLPASAAK